MLSAPHRRTCVPPNNQSTGRLYFVPFCLYIRTGLECRWFFDNGLPLPEEKHCTLQPKGPKADKLVILHFNDVYEIGSGKVRTAHGSAESPSTTVP